MRGLLLGLLMLLCANAYASEIDIVAHGLSYHFRDQKIEEQHQQCTYHEQTAQQANVECRQVTTERRKGHEWLNIGIGVRYAPSDSYAVQAGVYRNSFERTSVYLAGEALYRIASTTRVGVTAGVVTGYPYYGGDPGLMGALVVRQQLGAKVELAARIIPPINPKASGAVALELAYRIR